jgi:hypothetical protein
VRLDQQRLSQVARCDANLIEFLDELQALLDEFYG